MAAQASPTTAIHPHHQLQARPQANGHGHPPGPPLPQHKPAHALTQLNEAVWLQLGSLSELMGELESATQAYERALVINPASIPAMVAISCILRSKDQFPAAVEYLQSILRLDASNGETWSSLGHCYLMMDDLQKAYSAYQQALYHLPNPKEPKLWYGIGILYDRYGSLEHAEEAFSQVMRMEPNFEKANEIYFRLGIIYKQQQKFMQSLECFKYIVADPPRPLSEEDIWFQIGHVYEQQKDYDAAKTAYARVLERDPNHAKVLQQLGWLHHQQSTSFSSQEQAIEYLEKSVSADQTDAQSWYLLGRCYMSQQKYPKAYEAYQQAVYRDGRNPTFWCSIGVLYYQINQYRDALDAYSRAIRLNPNISEVWYDLGTLYESCNNQTSDALDAYNRAAELDPTNVHIKARLALLKGQPTDGLPASASAPLPQDVHPQAYQPGALGAPPGPQFPGAAPANQQPPPGPPPPALGGPADWGNRRLAGIQAPDQPPQTLGPYEGRDRLPPHAGQPRQPSPPRQEPPRQSYQDVQRPPPPSHRGLSPSPKLPYSAALPPYQAGPQGTPHPQLPPQQPLPGANRVTNPNYAPPGPPGSMAAPPPHMGGGSYNSGRVASPAPDIRPIVEGSAAPSPNGYPRQPHHGGLPSISGGAPPPTSAIHAAEAAARERDERQPKRHREWEDDSASKRHANDESRSRQEDVNSRRPSPPDKASASPHASSIDVRRQEERRLPANDGYHPSEAAHHQPLPPMSHPQETSPRSVPPVERREQPTPTPAAAVPAPPTPQQTSPKTQLPFSQRAPTPQAPPQHLEPAARKMDVDEDYDDSGDEDKKVESKRTSPGAPTNGTSASHANGTAAEPTPTPAPTSPKSIAAAAES